MTLLADWQADSALAARDRKPLVLFFSLPGCRFCEHVRQNYMLALARRGELVREVVLDGVEPVKGFAGGVTHRELAHSMGVTFAPLVLLLDARGNRLAEPIVGGDVAGMYGGYLDNAFEEAARRLAQPGAM
jgi:thioredoxin-related protein